MPEQILISYFRCDLAAVNPSKAALEAKVFIDFGEISEDGVHLEHCQAS